MKRTLDQGMESRGALHSEILSDQAAKAGFGKRQKVIVLVAAGVFFYIWAFKKDEYFIQRKPLVEDSSLLDRVFPLHSLVEELPSKQYLKKFTHLIVTGPQRSGTTFVAKVLADALKYKHVDELENVELHHAQTCNHSNYTFSRDPEHSKFQCKNCWSELFISRESIVAQRPVYSHLLHELPELLLSEACATPKEKILIIFMARNCLDVFRSQNKILHMDGGGWTCKFGRAVEWKNYRDSPKLEAHIDLRDMICKIKQDSWKNYQYMRLKKGGIPVLTLGYDLLQISWIRTEFQKNVAVRNKFGPKEIGIA